MFDVFVSDERSVEELVFFDIKYILIGILISDGYYWDGIRFVKTYKGLKRFESILSDFWKMFSSKDR